MNSISVVQITDTHLLANRDEKLRGVATWHSLKTILDRAIALDPDLLLLTGDLADTGSHEAYCHLLALLEPLTMPVYWLPGNHDRPLLASAVLRATSASDRQSFRIGTWKFILLDSVLATARWGEGRLSQASLTQLEAELERDRNCPTLVALHHHPILTGLDWLDAIALENSQQFLEICERFEQVRVVLFGHIHQTLERVREPISFYGCPSTCTQVELPESASMPEWKQPGFRWLELYPDGTHQTRVHRMSRTAGG